MGLVNFMDEEANKPAAAGAPYSFDFQILEPPEVILPLLISGELDIALIPANASSVVYQRSNGGVQVLNINTLGALYVVSSDVSISSFADLGGRTVLMTGKGATPEYVMNTLLAHSGIDGVRLEYKSEITELAAAIVADPQAIAVMPEPFVTSVLSKAPTLAVRLSLAEVWSEAVHDGSEFVLGVTVVRADFAAEHPEAVQEFLARQAASVESVIADPKAASMLVAGLGFIENAEIAERAIPNSNLVFITGAEMKRALGGYLAALYAQDPASIGGALPEDDFFYASP